MSGKMAKTSASSMSTQSAKKRTKRIRATPTKPDVLPEVVVLSRSSSSPLTEVYKTEEFKNEWANEVRFHVARNLLHLRRYRAMTQVAVGNAMGTSQSAVARIESAQENITLDTLQRLVLALKGRFQVSIHPQEYPLQQRNPWWEATNPATETSWSIFALAGRRGVRTDQVLVGFERSHGLSVANTSVLGPRLLPEGNTAYLGREA
jgi:transcriptional regulator with XRE-family HTH domain